MDSTLVFFFPCGNFLLLRNSTEPLEQACTTLKWQANNVGWGCEKPEWCPFVNQGSLRIRAACTARRWGSDLHIRSDPVVSLDAETIASSDGPPLGTYLTSANDRGRLVQGHCGADVARKRQ